MDKELLILYDMFFRSVKINTEVWSGYIDGTAVGDALGADYIIRKTKDLIEEYEEMLNEIRDHYEKLS